MEPPGESPRWHGQKSSFPWEQDALDHIKARIPQAALPVAMNLWCFRATPASDQEVVLRSFQFVPQRMR